MKHTRLFCCVIAAMFSSSALAQTETQRIDQLEQQVKGLQQLTNTPAKEKLRFNGFFSTGVAVASNDALYAGFTEQTDVDTPSLFGLQGAFSLSPSTDVVMQLVARGGDEWDPSMEWAYVSHKVSNNLTARAGKLRLPTFMYSDSLDIGYSQPWARPPIEVYGEVPISNHTGVDMIYDWRLDNSTITTQIYYGHVREADINARNSRGIGVTWSDFVWKLRTNYGATDFVFEGQRIGVEFYGFGAGFDNGDWQVVSELTEIKIPGVFPDPRSAYITAAKRFGAFTPYATIAWTETQDDDLRQLSRADAFAAFSTPGSPFQGDENVFLASEISNRERQAMSLGLRWDILSRVALKFDITKADSFGDTGGGLDGNIAPVVQYDDSTIYTIKIDSAF